MSYIDAGINLTDPRFDLPSLFSRAKAADIKAMLVISSTIDDTEKALSLAYTQPFNLNCTAGVHPHYADQTDFQTWAKLKQLIADKHIVAVGECGLDFNRNFSTKSNQLYAFEQQLAIASEHNIGVYLHERDAFEEQITLLEKYVQDLPFMVAHCFTGTPAQLSTYVELGCYIGITGWLCDNKRGQDLQEAVKHLPLERLLFETDGPYLFPKTLRPRKSVNEPCNIPYIAAQFAQLTAIDISIVEQSAYNNAQQLFFKRGINETNEGDVD